MGELPYCVKAFNSAMQSENRMHDDAVAQRYGFRGGLVPGADIFAYMVHAPVAKWGRAFLERGLMEVRFVRPVYDGETVEVEAEPSNDCLVLTLKCGDVRAIGKATLPAAPPIILIADFPKTMPVKVKEPVSNESFPVNEWLGTAPRRWTGQSGADYRAKVQETDPIYAREDLLHPGALQRIMNCVLMDNAQLGPWIHVASRMQLLSATTGRDEIVARAQVTANYERKGNRFVEVVALLVANGRVPIAHCRHVAIYQPRLADHR
jgi:acyl dehydratase